MASQRFCLRWNNHQSNLLSVFDQLLRAETFTDVTLAVEGHLLKAHKMVLSACSPYFRALFVSHQEKDPIVILKDVPYADMRSLLDFMYRGEVSVDQERLTAFLRVAESLRIKGLTEVNEEKADAPPQTVANAATTPTPGPPPQLHRLNRSAQTPRSETRSPPAQQRSSDASQERSGPPQPKRKRGRPRKLSGGEEAEVVAAAAAAAAANNVVKEEPEKLEVSVGTEGFGQEEPQSGDEEASLLIDEGDERAEAASPPAALCRLVNSSNPAAFRDDDHPNATPVITLELLAQRHTEDEECQQQPRPTLVLDAASGVHFLTDDQANSLVKNGAEGEKGGRLSPVRSKQELLEYLIRSDGSVICKICGEILQSRTHWYRHKYKFHVAPPNSAAPIFKCEQCSVFFKSKKGYIGHLASRHPESDFGNADTTAQSNQENIETSVIKQEPLDAELAIPSCELPNANYTGAIAYNSGIVSSAGYCGGGAKSDTKTRRTYKGNEPTEMGATEWEKQRIREERLVADIIARVRRECEAAGTPGGTRRGYSRRSALTNG